MRFDLTDLRLFVYVADSGTITAGATRAHMTVASASERIRGMESALNVPLLNRGRRACTLTDAGHTLLRHARVVLAQMDRLHGDLDDFGRGLAGHVRIMCNTAGAQEHLPAVLPAFLHKYPRVAIEIEEHSSHAIADALRMGTCDIGLLSNAEDLAGLHTQHIRSDPLVAVVQRGHRLAASRHLALTDLLDMDFVGLNDRSALQRLIDVQARRLGARLRYRVRLGTLDAVCKMAGAGIGVGIVPQTAARRCASIDRLHRIPMADSWAHRQLLLAYPGNGALSPFARLLVDYLTMPATS
ncbi:MAG: LysR family transcriptional regulator [Burkholderiaceae bacterium]|nr:LysR family transcriptional regulator [Burkholderiaceae bacterium]